MSHESSPSDVFGVIFAAQSSKCTWKSLLLYSITLRNPLFAELAASDKVTYHTLLRPPDNNAYSSDPL